MSETGSRDIPTVPLPAPVPSPGWWLIPNEAPGSPPLELPEPFFNRYADPLGYDPGTALISAVNVALLLGQPLLLTGEPGCGKTSLAYWLADQMGVGKPLVHVVKSLTTGRDLLYSFDELARFRDAQGGPEAQRPQQDYLELNPLGRAILFSAGPEGQLVASDNGPIGRFPRPHIHAQLNRTAFPERRRQIVLIDELDKAPRDTPNDLLSEIERMEFRIPEVGITVRGDEAHRPVVVITSNSDKSLPEPFLRRCVYHHIPAPDHIRRAEIIAKRRPPLMLERPELFEDAMAMFERIRLEIGRDGRQPGTAELLAWLDTINRIYSRGIVRLEDERANLAISIATLGKTRDDRALIRRKLGFDE